MSTINMQIESAFKAMLDQHTTTMVEALAAKYGFDAAEAMAHIEIAEAPKAANAIKAVKAVKAPKAAKATKVVDPDKPKKGPNAYLMWAKEARTAVKSSGQFAGHDITRELGRMWREDVTEDVKAIWKEKAGGSSSGSTSEQEEE
jgi:hypothetical protein